MCVGQIPLSCVLYCSTLCSSSGAVLSATQNGNRMSGAFDAECV